MLHTIKRCQQVSLVTFRFRYRYSSQATSPEYIERICRVIRTYRHTKDDLDAAMKELGFEPSPHMLQQVLRGLLTSKVNVNGKKAFAFFTWAGLKNQQCSNIASYEIMIDILTQKPNYNLAWFVFQQMKDKSQDPLSAARAILHCYIKNTSMEETLYAFKKMKTYAYGTGLSTTSLVNVLLQGYCKYRNMVLAHYVFKNMLTMFRPDKETFNILLKGFQEHGDFGALDIFYKDLLRRGFEPDVVTYNTLIVGFCKASKFTEALQLFETMRKKGCMPDVHTYTILIKGCGDVGDVKLMQQLFDEMQRNGVPPDTVTYHAFVYNLCKKGFGDEALRIVNVMEEREVPCKGLPYERMFSSLASAGKSEAVIGLYDKMIANKHALDHRSVSLLMRYFCQTDQLHMALRLWDHAVENKQNSCVGAITVLVHKLCSCEKFQEAFDCCDQFVQRVKYPPKEILATMGKFLQEPEWEGKLLELHQKLEQVKKSMNPESEWDWGYYKNAPSYK